MHIIYMSIYYVLGLNPWGFHLVSVLFHAGVSVMVFIITSRLLRDLRPQARVSSTTPAFMAALLFAAHPIHTEAVAWAAGLPDLSFTFFYLLSFYLYIRSKDSNAPFSIVFFLSIASFFLAALCKEPALTLPLIIAAYDCTLQTCDGQIYLIPEKIHPLSRRCGNLLHTEVSCPGGLRRFKTTSGVNCLSVLYQCLSAFRAVPRETLSSN